MGNAVFEEKKAYYKMSNFVLTSTLIEPKTTEIKTGPEAQLYEMINQNEKQYGVKKKALLVVGDEEGFFLSLIFRGWNDRGRRSAIFLHHGGCPVCRHQPWPNRPGSRCLFLGRPIRITCEGYRRRRPISGRRR